ncbi:PhnE/PtxC family ABC transporter permease [Mycoplasma sp. 1573]
MKKIFTFSNVSDLNGFDQNLVKLTFKYLGTTLQYALAGTFIGFVAAIISASLSSKNYNNKYVSFFARYFVLFLRSIPEIVFITLFNLSFYSKLALILIFLWFSWLWLHKYFIEAIDNLDKTPYYIARRQGKSHSKAYCSEVMPRLFNRFMSLYLYSFESNMRWASLLAALGAPGIGQLIYHSTELTQNMSQLGIPLGILLLVVIALEVINLVLKKHVFEVKSRDIKTRNYNQLAKQWDWRLLIKTLIFIFSIAIAVWSFATINLQKMTASATLSNFLKNIFTPDWNIFENVLEPNFFESNFGMLVQSLMLAVMTLTITLVLSFALAPFATTRLSKSGSVYCSKFFIASLRLIPEIIIFFIFKPIINDATTLIIFILGICSMGSFTKQFAEMIDNVDEEIIANLKMQGWSKSKIYFRYVLPSVKKDLVSLSLFYFENAFRNIITYSAIVGQNMIMGYKISNLLNERGTHLSKAAAIMWIATAAIFAINILSEIIIWRINTISYDISYWQKLKIMFTKKSHSFVKIIKLKRGKHE